MFNINKKNKNSNDWEFNEIEGNEEKSDNLTLDQKIESILFYKADEVSLRYLVKNLNLNKETIYQGIRKLRERLKNSALVLVENQDKFLLGLKPEADEIILNIKDKQDLPELSTAALETLAIILYNKEISRDEINQIRGINSSYILRNLLIRGLIDKKDKGLTTVYYPTTDLFLFLGIEKNEDLPGFDKVREKIKDIQEEYLRIEKENQENLDNNSNIKNNINNNNFVNQNKN